MANITTTVPNLIQGVNQQSPQVRFAGQCEEQINGLSTITNGLTKRPPARLIENLGAVVEEGDFVHFINRSDTERYVVILENRTDTNTSRGSLRAYNLITGNEATINNTSGGYTYDSDYLVNQTPTSSYKDFKAITIGDSTFLLNTKKVVEKNNTLSSPYDESKALVFVKQGDYKKEYGIRFNERGDENGATLTVTWKSIFGGAGTNKTLTIKSITIEDGGTNYNEETDFPAITWPSEVKWEIPPSIDFTFTGGVITGVNVVDGGRTESDPSLYVFNNVSTVYVTPPGSQISLITGDSNDHNHADSALIARDITSLINDQTTTGTHNTAVVSNAWVSANFTAKNSKSSLVITKNDNNGFHIDVFDGLSGQGLGVAYLEVDSLSDLPLRAPDGFRVAVRGDVNANEDDYYVRFSTNDGQAFGEGGWIEEVGPNVLTELNADTMPLQLVNTGVDTFEIQTVAWADRKAGDDNTNPFPSFVGKTLNNFVFFKNRFGFLYEDSVVLSEAAELFNFFRTTVRTLLDTAPIDLTAATANVSNIHSSATFQENLLLFADRGQFVLKGDPLTNETVTMNAVTNYDVDTTQNPFNLGSYVYFPFKRGNFIGLQEYSLNATTDVYDSDEITTQVPSYLESGNILKLTGSSVNNLIAVCPGGRTFYVYKYFFNGREKVVSSWSKFVVPFDVVSLEFMDSTLYLVGNHNGETFITEMKCEDNRIETDTTGGFTVHLDFLDKHTVSSSPGTANITLQYLPENADDVEVYDVDGNKIKVNSITGTSVSIESTGKTCFSGLKYNLEYTFSEPVFKQGNPPVPSGLSRMILRNGTLFFTNAVDFQVEVTPQARDKRVFHYSPNIVNVTSTDSLLASDGSFKFSVYTAAKDSVIKIVNDSPFASNFQSCEFEANVHTRANRIQ